MKNIAFVVGVFPAVSETWMINQVAGALDRGFDVDIYSFERQDEKNVSDVYRKYKMSERTRYIGMPENKIVRIALALPKIIRLLLVSPGTLFKSLNVGEYGRNALSLKFLFWSEAFAGKKYDLIHLHDGVIAARFLTIRDIAGIKGKLLTSFYGQDVSRRVKENPHIYDRLKKTDSEFIVMSDYMRKRVVDMGFDEKRVHTVSIFGIDVDAHPFKERTISPGETFEIAAMGRFVEKKGFDDILRALAIVKQKANRKFHFSFIGGGELDQKLRKMTTDLDLDDVVSYKGYMKIEDAMKYLMGMHLYLQPSKMASDGDQE